MVGSSNTPDWNAPHVSRSTGNRWKYHTWAWKGRHRKAQHQQSIISSEPSDNLEKPVFKGIAWSCIAKCWLWFDRMWCLQGAWGMKQPQPHALLAMTYWASNTFGGSLESEQNHTDHKTWVMMIQDLTSSLGSWTWCIVDSVVLARKPCWFPYR